MCERLNVLDEAMQEVEYRGELLREAEDTRQDVRHNRAARRGHSRRPPKEIGTSRDGTRVRLAVSPDSRF